MPAKKLTLKFFFSQSTSFISLEYVHKRKLLVYSLSTYLLNNPTKFKFNQTRTIKFQLKLFNIAVTLEYGQGHWKWYEQVTLKAEYHNASFTTFTVSEKISMLQFLTSPDTWPPKIMLIISTEYTLKSHKSYCAWSI